jgi:hypothetical protein
LTNYYDSASLYENQNRLFKPIVDEQKKVQDVTKNGNENLANITEALEYKKYAAGNQESFLGDLLNLKEAGERERDAKLKREEEVTVKHEDIKPLKLQPVVIKRNDVAAYFAFKDINTDPLFDLTIDGCQLGTMLVLKELALENGTYFMVLPEHKDEVNMIRCVDTRDRVHDHQCR